MKFANILSVKRSTVYGYFKTKSFSDEIKDKMKSLANIDIDSIEYNQDDPTDELIKEINFLKEQLKISADREKWLQSIIDKLSDKE